MIKKTEKKIIKKEHSSFTVTYYSALHGKTLIAHAHSSQFME